MAELSLDDGTIWYEERGEGRPLVFVHGGWSSSAAWDRQVERFADSHRVITVDVRGHGETGATDARRYSVGLFADDLEALLDHLDVEDPVLCGLSLGSMVVHEYLSRHPDAAAGAVLAGPVRSMPPVDMPAAVKPFVSPLPALGMSLSTLGSEATFRSMLGSIRATTGGVWLALEPSVRSEALDAVGEVPASEFRKIFGALYHYDPPSLVGVSTPTLVVYGDEEAPPVKRQGQAIASEVDDGRVLEIANAAHMVNQDAPEAFNDALAEFLDGLDAGGAVADERGDGRSAA
ncbi:alpha/beta hydrolase [Halostella sp. JP-L12]|uniref:alpha/beta fold hydrolase n=1 Tax=Halostella TaxID=1843185 RepID=UPI000EF7F5FF|nr:MULTISPECIES: alpha/beta hydrolase [Halostella]NHN48113.1 alpha/beta hydrolase [Halostella sp. JP-L12]